MIKNDNAFFPLNIIVMNEVQSENLIEYKGYWFLPSNPDKKIAGVLTFYPNEKIELELFGCLTETINVLCDCQQSESVIWGKTSDAKKITLLNAFMQGQRNLDSDFPLLRCTCRYMIIGKHINGLDEMCHYWAKVEIPLLSYWCHPSVISLNTDCSTMNISFHIDKDEADVIQTVEVYNKTSILLVQNVSYIISDCSISIDQSTHLEIIKQEASSINELLKDISLYEQFLSLAILEKVKCSSIVLYDEDCYQLVGESKHYSPIYIIGVNRWLQPLTTKRTLDCDFLFDYTTIEHIYPFLLLKWYSFSKQLFPIQTHLINSLETKKVFSSADFLAVFQALDSFESRFRNYNVHKLKDKIEAIVAEFYDIELIRRLDIDAKAAADSRNYYSHFYSSDNNQKVILRGIELYNLTLKLRVLLICCVLSLIGFNNTQINELIKKSSSSVFLI